MIYGQPSPFPPSFDGSPFSYGFGLFGDIVAASLSLTMLLSYMFEARRARQVLSAVHSPIPRPDVILWSPLYLYRMGKMSILTFVVMRTLPDAVWMLAWGEVSQTTIEILLVTDLVFDGLALLPLVTATFCWAWSRQLIPQLLTANNHAEAVRKWPWDVIFRNGRIALMVMVIAIGVTIGKASA